MRTVVAALLIGAGLLGCDVAGHQASPPPGAVDADVSGKPDGRTVIRVATAEEFVQAIGPNRILELAPGEYNLTKVVRRRLKHVGWQEAYDGQYDLIIRNASDLAIRGTGKEPSHVLVNEAYSTVLNFADCTRIELRNLKLGHDPDRGYCTGGVIRIDRAADVRIDGCILYGCGTYGLQLSSVKNLLFRKSIIEECTYGIAGARECESLRFEDSVFRTSMEYTGFEFGDSGDISFLRCRIEDNVLGGLDGPLFATSLNAPADRIRFVDGVIRNNSATAMVKPAGMVALDKTTVTGNSWQAPEDVRKRRGTKTPAPSGGWHYHVPVGEARFWGISIEVYGTGWFSQALQKANPTVQEPVQVDTKIYCPPNPKRDVHPESQES
jgi:hypothetical protein